MPAARLGRGCASHIETEATPEAKDKSRKQKQGYSISYAALGCFLHESLPTLNFVMRADHQFSSDCAST